MSAAASSDAGSNGTSNQHDEFVHNIAIKLSRALNTLNPNDLLARRVLDIAKGNAQDESKFISGKSIFIIHFRNCGMAVFGA
jgi:hypothetical protein